MTFEDAAKKVDQALEAAKTSNHPNTAKKYMDMADRYLQLAEIIATRERNVRPTR